MQEILELMKELQQPGVAVDISAGLLKQIPPDEREAFIRQMIEGCAPNDLSPEQQEAVVQAYLCLIDSDDIVSCLEKLEQEMEAGDGAEESG